MSGLESVVISNAAPVYSSGSGGGGGASMVAVYFNASSSSVVSAGSEGQVVESADSSLGLSYAGYLGRALDTYM